MEGEYSSSSDESSDDELRPPPGYEYMRQTAVRRNKTWKPHSAVITSSELYRSEVPGPVSPLVSSVESISADDRPSGLLVL